MFLHQALPKDAQVLRKPTYQIRRRFSPKIRQLTRPEASESVGNSLSRNQHPQKARLHFIASKQKPTLCSVDKHRKSPIPKHISSLHIKNSILRTDATPQKCNDVLHSTAPFALRDVSERQMGPQHSQDAFTMCKIVNRATKSLSCGLLYSDLSTIDVAYFHTYQGQTIGNRIRHGFGSQWFTNGEKFVGIFKENKACGQGTYYSLKKKIMGNWQSDRLKEVILQL